MESYMGEVVEKTVLAIFFGLLFYFPAHACEELIIEPEQGRQPILEAIAHAQTNLDLAMYGFTDPDLMQAFIQAQARSKKVRILLQHYPYKNLDENLLAIQRFSASRIHLGFAPSTFYLLHQKTLLIDQNSALVMTFNFTRSSFKKERNFGLMITDPVKIQEIQQVFNADWQNQSTQMNKLHLIWSPDNSRQKILDFIKGAKKEIKVYAQGLSDYQIIGALAEAARKGLEVQVLTSGSEPDKKWEYLQKAGVRLAIDKQLIIHAKVIIVDQASAILGSINFTQTSLDKNRELAVLTQDARVVHQLLEIYGKDWKLSHVYNS